MGLGELPSSSLASKDGRRHFRASIQPLQNGQGRQPGEAYMLRAKTDAGHPGRGQQMEGYNTRVSVDVLRGLLLWWVRISWARRVYRK